MVSHFRAAVGSDPTDLQDFDAAIGGHQPAQQYQAAATFLIERIGIDTLNRAIRLAVLRARTPHVPHGLAASYIKDEGRLRDLELDAYGWAIPRGTSALGRILALVPPDKRGPVLTTNFDPLVEVSLTNAGLTPMPIAADSEGAIMLPDVPDPRIVPVAHLHGYWRSGDTLHTGTQLSRNRPKLIGSLRQILTGSVGVVVGYGGWDDVLTRAIGDLVAEGAERELEILWASFGPAPSLGVLESAQLPGRLQPYVGVDANTFLPAVENEIQVRIGRPPSRGTPLPRNPPFLGNLISVDHSFIEGYAVQSVDPSSTINFYNGRAPDWTDVVAGRLPYLSWVEDALRLLNDPSMSSLGLALLGPAGEGKSTGLRQIALTLSESEQNSVYWANPVAPIPVTEILDSLAGSRMTWVICDDADLQAGLLHRLVSGLRARGRTDVRLVLAARDTDWQRSTSSHQTFSSADLSSCFIGGLTREDAESIVSAWERHGLPGLGALAHLQNHQERADALFRAGHGAEDSSLLGALLSVRFSTQFDDHVRELLQKLERVLLPRGRNLLSVYLVICYASKFGMPGVKRSHLAEWLQISLHEVDALVISRLGREAAVQRYGEFVLPRHERIASVATRIGLEMGYRDDELFPDLVGSVASAFRGRRWDDAEVDLVYSGQRIAQRTTAIAAVDAAATQDPVQFRLVSSQLGVHRKFHMVDEAWTHAVAAWDRRENMDDWRIGLRPFLVQWGWIAQLMGRGRDSAGLNACVLLDLPAVGKVDRQQGSRGLYGLATALGMFAVAKPADVGVWRATLLDLALELGVPETLRGRAEDALAEQVGAGFQCPETPDGIRSVLHACIGTAIRTSSVGPARTFRSDSGHMGGLFELLDI